MAHDIAQVMFDTAVLRSGYTIPDSVSFAKRILEMMYSNMDIDPNTPVSLLIFIIESFTFFFAIVSTSCMVHFAGKMLFLLLICND